MKRINAIFLSFFVSILFIELLTGYFLSFPKYNIDKRIIDIRKTGDTKLSDLYVPNSRYFTTENGYRVLTKNNIGLSGSDIVVSDSSKYVYVIGSSLILAEQIEKNKIATSFLQKGLSGNRSYQVINIGEKGHDIYDSYFRLKYFENKYKPAFVILVVEKTYTKWIRRHKDTLDFIKGTNFGKEYNPIINEFASLVRMNSSFANLLVSAYKIYLKNLTEPNIKQLEEYNYDAEMDDYNYFTDSFFKCIKKYSEDYGGKFILISIITDKELNLEIKNYCNSFDINFFNDESIFLIENRNNKTGHLNQRGNFLLGDMLTKSLLEVIN